MPDDRHDDDQKSLQRPLDPSEMPAPLAAMAEALRANAQALHKIDESQRKMAETMERTDKSAQVITSTKALNETFRSLSDIQRGLLDALVNRRGFSIGVVLVLLLLFGVMAGLGGFWAAQRFGPRDPSGVTGAAHAAAVQRASDFERVARDAERRYEDAKQSADDWKTRQLAAETERLRLNGELTASRAGLEPLRLRIKELEGEAGVQKARLSNFLEVKAQADQASVFQQRNAILERDNTMLTGRVQELERKLTATQEFFGKKLMDGNLGDPEAIKEIASKLGFFEKDSDLAGGVGPGKKADGAEQKGPVLLTQRARRVIEQQLRRLLVDQGDESVQILKFRAMEGRNTLHKVTLGRYRLGRLVNQIVCETLQIRVDPKADTVELVCKGGNIITSRPRATRIPIDEGGHSLFLVDVDLKAWLNQYRYAVLVEDGGMLTWKAVPN